MREREKPAFRFLAPGNLGLQAELAFTAQELFAEIRRSGTAKFSGDQLKEFGDKLREARVAFHWDSPAWFSRLLGF